ncbi:unnamed protein product [Hymenolepis diminuta]|uniref:Uncharacterized protein n=1 Tax=Hymenolepis diminuta TaxID=6216 RepID=A0A564Z3S6_HYMDI|nr:unnamed protein product [Hymenolepis diminuta]
MADEYQDNYGAFVFNNYARNCELAMGTAMCDEAKADLLRNAATTNMRRTVCPQRPINKCGQGSTMWAKKWPNLNGQSGYLSLDSDSDSDSCCGSSTTCTCSKCCGSTYCSSSRSSLSYSSSGCCGCRCNCQVTKDHRHRKSRGHNTRMKSSDSSACTSSTSSSSSSSTYCSKNNTRAKSTGRCSVCHKPLDNVREKKMIASSQPSKYQGRNTMNAERYHRCKTSRENTPRLSRGRSMGRSGFYQGVNPEIRPGPYGNKFFTEEDVYRKYFRDPSVPRDHPEPDLILYPID